MPLIDVREPLLRRCRLGKEALPLGISQLRRDVVFISPMHVFELLIDPALNRLCYCAGSCRCVVADNHILSVMSALR